jgi:hypothetical protein
MSAVPESFLGAAANDADAQETREWLDALSAVIATEGPERAHFLLEQLIGEARQAGIDHPFSANTAYVNTIPTDQEERCPGNLEIEERLRAYMRWNAMAMVVKANRLDPADGGDLGGHISSSRRSPPCSVLASTTSGMPRRKTTVVTCCTSRAIPRPASTPALSWKAASAKNNC